MKFSNIHDKWGCVVEFEDPLDFFKTSPDIWRAMAYKKGLLVFKRMTFTKEDYAKFCACFGSLWNQIDYKYSKEASEVLTVNGQRMVVSYISNITSPRLGLKSMPWHSDIPNRPTKPFPFRALWMVSNPNPDSGLTGWLNIEQGLTQLPENLKSRVDQIKIIQQSWYDEGTDIQKFSFVKTHPITNKQSLRLNYYCDPENDVTDAWIKNVEIDGNILPPKETLLEYYSFLETQQDLLYTHRWDDYDLVIYDNWPFVHNRTTLEFDPSQERKFYRANIDHLTNNEWLRHKATVLNQIL
jgi:alpha-ketoglutarate-dependent taurine dioxygenase